MTEGRFVTYLRVSTERQGQSGLGVEAQRKAVTNHLKGGQWKLLAEFVEVESGKTNDRPELAQAIERCRLTGATLLIAKLDRLSRNAAFLMNLRDSGVTFIAADMPDANALTVGIMALIAQHEREAISARTKAALEICKARGVRLGNPRAFGGKVYRAGGKARAAMADEFAQRVGPTIRKLRAEGLTLAAIAERLTAMDVRTARAGAWQPTTVKNVLDRIAC